MSDNHDIRRITLLEELRELSQQIELLIVEKRQNINNFDERLKILYTKLYKTNNELMKLFPIEKEK